MRAVRVKEWRRKWSTGDGYLDDELLHRADFSLELGDLHLKRSVLLFERGLLLPLLLLLLKLLVARR